MVGLHQIRYIHLQNYENYQNRLFLVARVDVHCTGTMNVRQDWTWLFIFPLRARSTEMNISSLMTESIVKIHIYIYSIKSAYVK